MNPTVKGGQIDQRPVVFAPSDGGVRIGGHEGASPNTDPRGRQPQTGMEYGPADDMMEVYRGGKDGNKTFDSPPVWRYIAKDALHSPNVPAVDQFRKAIDETEKAIAKNAKHP